jgi:sugar phosphate permease
LKANAKTYDGDTEISPYRWVILFFAVLSFVLTFICRFSWPPLIPVIVPILHISMKQAGAYMSAFYLGYLITQIPSGILADRFGVRAVLGFALVLAGGAQWAMGSITSFETGFWLRFIIGLGSGAVMSSCARAVVEWFPAKERGTAFGILIAGLPMGVLLANYIVPALNAAFNWQVAYHIIGVAVVTLGVLVYSFIRSTVEEKQEQSLLGGIPAFFTNRDLILLGLAGSCLLWMEIGFVSWANAYIKNQLGFSVKEAGLVLICYSVGGVLACPVSGWLSDLVGNRKEIMIGSYLLAAPLTVVFGYQKSLKMLIIVAFIYGFCSYCANPHLGILVVEKAGKNRAATATGISNVMFQLSSMIGPFILGWSIDITKTFNSVWFLLGAGPLVGVLMMIGVRPPTADTTGFTPDVA